MAIQFTLNDEAVSADVASDTPLLWVLRDTFKLTGTKFGCGVAACGACTVHVDGVAVRTCVLPVSAIAGKHVTTIEHLASTSDKSKDGIHPLQQAWIDEQVPQCGYCQSGMLMAAASLLDSNPAPSDEDIDSVMTNICRCGTYQRVRSGIHTAVKLMANGVSDNG